MSGGGPRYEPLEQAALLEQMVLPPRRERIDEVVKGRTRAVTVVLDRLEDSFNMAAVLRTCEAFGLQEVHVVKNPGVPFAPNRTVTQGCDKWLDIVAYDSFADAHRALKQRGFRVLTSAIVDGAQSLWNLRFDTPTALVFGNERFGVSQDVLNLSDGTFWIPMRGFVQSMNISAATSAVVSRAIAWRLEHLGVEGDISEADQQELRVKFMKLSVKQHHKWQTRKK